MMIVRSGVKVHIALIVTDMMAWTPPSTDASV